MNTLKQADEYLRRTSAKDIFTRMILYVVYYERKQTSYDNLIIPIYLAALCGPFNMKILDSPIIKELAISTNYALNDDWQPKLIEWLVKYFDCPEFNQLFNNTVLSIKQKLPTIEALALENSHNPKPLEYYLYELKPFGQFNNHWPRI